MVVEHVFVTTTEEPEVMRRAAIVLGDMGFAAADDAPPGGFVYRRGKKSAAKARRISELPQVAAIQFDRGRVTLAASVEVRHKPTELHKEMLITLASAVQRGVHDIGAGADVLAAWRAVDAKIERKARRQRIVFITVAVLGLCVVAGLVGLVAATL